MSSLWAHNISISLFGESHGAAIGVVIDGLPPGEDIDMERVGTFLARRAARDDLISTQRQEPDVPQVLSGLFEGHTTGTPLCAMIANTDTRSADYRNVTSLARPGHADYTGFVRYKGANDVRGGGHFSGRLTAPLVFAGAVCAQILERRGIVVGAHIRSISGVEDTPFDPVAVNAQTLHAIAAKRFPTGDDDRGAKMRALINDARMDCDSVGGIVECAAVGLPAGIGSPMFDGLENLIASLVFGIPAVRGIEFGTGFASATMMGSEHNDPFYTDTDGTVRTRTNHHGGILGGISSGMPLLFRVAFKPTASISREQETIDYRAGGDASILVKGRHDPCIVPRAVPCVEAAASIALLGALLDI